MDEMREMFRYQTWANLQLVDHCATLPDETLRKSVPGTFGPILDTFLHMLEQERWGLYVLKSLKTQFDDQSLKGIRTAFLENGSAWESVLDRFDELDALELPEPKDWHRQIPHFPMMYALQTLHHQELHRTHIRATLTGLGAPLEDEDGTDVWAYWNSRPQPT